MRATLLFVLFAVLLLSSCKSWRYSGNKKLGKAKIEKTSLDKFLYNVVGLKKGDTIERVYEIYGEPSDHRIHEDDYSFNTVYYNVNDEGLSDERALSISYFKATHKIYVIDVQGAAPYLLKKKNVQDTLYIDLHADELRKIFGKKEYEVVKELRYEEDKFMVEFYCYEFNDYKCFNYQVYWWANK